MSAPFSLNRLSVYKDGDDADKFFRPALRSLLVSEIYLFIFSNADSTGAHPTDFQKLNALEGFDGNQSLA